ncbi:MAG: HigA family addiction module antidote protein [Treponema sp.]|jgi:addiction module HigA family antidote|nr:HigA family addiction module antidote protein [Treponema sp.]
MPKASAKDPGAVLKSLMDEYQLNPFKLAGEVKLSNSSVRQILLGKVRISASAALRFAKFFGNTPEFWLNLQTKTDLAEAATDKKLAEALKTIGKAKKPAPAKAAPKKAPTAKVKTVKPGKPAASKKPAAKAPRKPRAKKQA